jgi:WD40 repeat protein
MAGLALYFGGAVRKQERIRTAELLAQRSQEALGRFPQRAVLLVAEALAAARQADRPRLPEAETALRAALAGCGGTPIVQPGLARDRRVLGAVLGERGRWLATEAPEGRVRLSRLSEGAEVEEVLAPIETGRRLDVEFSPDGAWMATAGSGQTGDGLKTLVWALGGPGPRQALETVERRPRLAFGRRGMVLAEGRDGLHLWRLAGGAGSGPLALSPPGAAQGLVTSLVISDDERWLAALFGENGAARLWDLSAAAAVGIELSSGKRVHDLAFSPDGALLALAEEDGVSLHRVPDPTREEHLVAPEGAAPRHVRFAPGGDHLLASNGQAVDVWTWGAAAGGSGWAFAETARLPGLLHPTTGGWIVTTDGQQVHASRLEPALRRSSGLIPKVLTRHDQPLAGLAIDARERWLLSWDEASPARRWRLDGDLADNVAEPLSLGKVRVPFMTALAGRWALHFADEGRRLTAGTISKSFEVEPLAAVFDLAGAAAPTVQSLDCSPQAQGALGALSPGGRWFAALSEMGDLCAWSLEQPRGRSEPTRARLADRPAELGSLSGAFLHISVSGDGRWLAAAQVRQPTVWAVRLADGYTTPLTLPSAADWLDRLAFDVQGHWLAGAAHNGPVLLWDVSGDEPRKDPVSLVPHHEGSPNALVFSADGRWLFSGAQGDGGRLWDLGSGAEPKEATLGPARGVTSAAFSADGRRLAIGSEQGVAHLLHLDRPLGDRPSAVLPVASAGVTEVALSGDGARLFATGGLSRLWNVDQKAPEGTAVSIPTADGFPSSTTGAAFSPDGRWLATASDEGVLLWDLDLDSVVRKACPAAGRNLTCAEWREALGGEPYRKTCPELPDPSDATRPGTGKPCG